ncbi:hypothetical protein ACFSEO_08710 [Agromyces cerinus subsp. nitratus]|uniref:hypothetical protein n=1 Tax=Agromyces cerinus TaxID=33878 RepID=UPI0036325F57
MLHVGSRLTHRHLVVRSGRPGRAGSTTLLPASARDPSADRRYRSTGSPAYRSAGAALENGPASEETGPDLCFGAADYSAGFVTTTDMVPPVFWSVTVTVTLWPAT